MKLKYTAIQFATVFALCFWALLISLIAGCGGGSQDAPNGSTIVFQPSEVSLSSGVQTSNTIMLTVFDSSGLPMPFVDVNIYGTFAEPVSTRYRFYSDSLCTPGNEQVSGFPAQTIGNGSYTFCVSVASNLTGTFSDEGVHANSGSIYGSMTIENL